MNALIPWYLNGTLAETERAQVEAWLRESPDAGSELQMWRAVQADARTQPLTQPGVDFGWQRLRRDLKREQRRGSLHTWRVAAAASVLMIVGLQTAILVRQDAGTRYEPLSGTLSIPANAWRVQVRFAESAAVSDINALLLRLDARVISGPSALGIYELALPREAAADAQALRTKLAAESLLLQVVLCHERHCARAYRLDRRLPAVHRRCACAEQRCHVETPARLRHADDTAASSAATRQNRRSGDATAHAATANATASTPTATATHAYGGTRHCGAARDPGANRARTGDFNCLARVRWSRRLFGGRGTGGQGSGRLAARTPGGVEGCRRSG
jgi:hypothetical protein